jgi:predicted transcriptional regulator
MTRMMIERAPEVNRAFSAGHVVFTKILGSCPRLPVNAAPLARDRAEALAGTSSEPVSMVFREMV